MNLRKAIHAGLALLVAAGLGVCANAAAGADQPKPKSSASSASSKTRKSTKKTSAKRKPRGQQAPTAERITEIQQALSKDGSFAGTANGKWDDHTAEAMRNFQTAHGLTPTGKLDARTLQKLGLGSTTAGVAPPTPPPNSTSRLVSSAGQPTTRQ